MARTTFTGPVVSNNGFEGPDLEASYVDITPVLDAALPAASADNQGQIRLISDSGVGENEFRVFLGTRYNYRRWRRYYTCRHVDC
jgi:hypothetical protein